jgi:hypothetical protein
VTHQQLASRPQQRGMPPVGRDLGERRQHEMALVKAQVRHGKTRPSTPRRAPRQHLPAIGQKVEIKHPVTPAAARTPTECTLDGLQPDQYF